MPTGRQAGGSALDRPAARLAAVAVALAAAGALLAIHWGDLLALVAGAPAPPDDPAAQCIAERHAGIDRGVAEGVFAEAQAALFKQRAEALCRAMAG